MPCRALSCPAVSSPVLPRSISSFSTKNSYKCTATVQHLQSHRAEPSRAVPRPAGLSCSVSCPAVPCRARLARAAVSAGSVVPLPPAVGSWRSAGAGGRAGGGGWGVFVLGRCVCPPLRLSGKAAQGWYSHGG